MVYTLSVYEWRRSPQHRLNISGGSFCTLKNICVCSSTHIILRVLSLCGEEGDISVTRIINNNNNNNNNTKKENLTYKNIIIIAIQS
jgi:hypothetical protein